MKKEISLAQLEQYLNTLFDATAFDEKAYNGVQIETKVPIEKIATAVSVSKEVIKKAVDMRAQALIVHHGIFRKGDAHPLVGRVFDYVQQLITHDIALLCYHLPMDAHQKIGNNWKAANDLGLKDCRPFFQYQNNCNIGVVGEINKMPFEEFKKIVEAYYGRPAAAVQANEMVETVAIISGGADKYIKYAVDVSADCFVTGTFDEPTWDDAREYGVSFLGLGHYATEVVAPRALAEHLEEHFGLPVEFIKTENPF